MRLSAPIAVALAGLMVPAASKGQTFECHPSNTDCLRMVDAAEATQSTVGIVFSGGNPIPGASSTLGMRLGALPRLSAAVRVTIARLEFLDPETTNQDELSSLPRSINADVAFGVFSGFSLIPTVGGFGSIDLVGSYGKGSLDGDDGFGDAPDSWSAGVRLGLLRESFTAPGVSVTASYRNIGDVRNDQPSEWFELTDNRALSVRATVGKRILMLGAVAGIGYDKYSSQLEVRNQDAGPIPGVLLVRDENFDHSRTTVFANLSWTMLILHIVGEGGVQRSSGDNAYYGSLAVRLAL